MFKKKLTALIISAVTMITSLHMVSFGFKSEAAEAELEMTAQELLDDITVGWNLGNTLENLNNVQIDEPYYYETSNSNPITTREMIKYVHDTGFNLVRIPVTWTTHMDSDGNVDPAWMKRVNEIVDYVVDEGMYCVVNTHFDSMNTFGLDDTRFIDATYENYDKNKERFAYLWSQIAENFKDYDQHLIFEGFNEMENYSDKKVIGPRNPTNESYDVINMYNQLFVDTIRAASGCNKYRILECSTYFCSYYYEGVLDKFTLPNDTIEDRLICQVHSYEPYNFTCEIGENSSETFNSKLYTFSLLKEKLLSRNIPVVVGEFACSDKNNTAEQVKWVKNFADEANKAGIKCYWWDDGNLLSRSLLQWKRPEVIDAVMNSFGIDYICPKYENYMKEEGNIASDISKWCTYFNNSLALLSGTAKTGSVSLNVIDGGKNIDAVQVFHSNIFLEEGKKYNVSFKAECSDIENQDMKLIIHHTSPSFREYYVFDDMKLTNEKQDFSFDFTIMETINFQ